MVDAVKRTRVSQLPSLEKNFKTATYKVKTQDGKEHSFNTRDELNTWKSTNNDGAGATIWRSIKREDRLAAKDVANLTVERLQNDAQGVGLKAGSRDHQLYQKLKAEEPNLLQSLNPWHKKETKVLNDLTSFYKEKEILRTNANTRKAVANFEQKYRSDLHDTLVDGVLSNTDQKDFSNSFYNDKHGNKDLTVTLPVETETKKAVISVAEKAKKAQEEIERVQTELNLIPANTSDIRETSKRTTLQKKLQREQQSLNDNNKELRKLLTADSLNPTLESEYFKVSDTVLSTLDTQAKQSQESLANINSKAPVPIVVGKKPAPPATPTTPPVVTEEVAQSKVQKLLDGIKEKHGLNDISGDSEITLTYPDGRTLTKKVKDLEDRDLDTSTKATEAKKTKENEKEAPKLTAGGWFRGFDADGNPLKEGFTWGGGLRSLGTAVVGVSVLRKIWSWLFPEDQITRAQLDALKARGGAV